MTPHILALESSCDETAVAVMKGPNVLAHHLTTQAIHEQYGGVVPELASRAHMEHIGPLVSKALRTAQITYNDLDAIACTQGPGLLGALLIGQSFAKGLALALDKPLVTVHHIKAHLLVNMLQEPKPTFPFLGFVVSGGHTQLIRANRPQDMYALGDTRDDAIGEAFDKIAKTQGLPYPGGKWIDHHAKKGNRKAFAWTKSKVPGLDFSFSGIKTAVRYFLDQQPDKKAFFAEHRADFCASIQNTLVAMATDKVICAMKEHDLGQLVVGGGVAANTALRASLKKITSEHGWRLFIPPLQYCTDNAAMIGIAAYHQYCAGDIAKSDFAPLPRNPLPTLK